TSIGVVTPLRAQATALEAALLARFDADRIAALELRVGTVHAFQGGERDVVVLSTAVTPDAPAGRRRFVEDPNLFNVMVTRARRRMIVVTSLDPTVGGLLGDYLAHAERPPTTPRTAVAAGWAADLAEELRRAGLPVRTGYPVGPHVVDIVVGDGPTAEALITLPHPAGPAAHAARRATLRRAGWRVREVFRARYEHRPALAVAELGPVLQAAGG